MCSSSYALSPCLPEPITPYHSWSTPPLPIADAPATASASLPRMYLLPGNTATWRRGTDCLGDPLAFHSSLGFVIPTTDRTAATKSQHMASVSGCTSIHIHVIKDERVAECMSNASSPCGHGSAEPSPTTPHAATHNHTIDPEPSTPAPGYTVMQPHCCGPCCHGSAA